MAEAYKLLYQGQPGVAAATVYTVPGSTSAIIKHIRVANPSAVTVTIKLFQGGTADANCILPATPLLAGEWAEFDGSLFMATGNTLAAQASVATSLTMSVYGVEVT